MQGDGARNMTDFEVKRNSTATLGRIVGGLKVGTGATLIAEDSKKIMVTEGAHFDGPVTIKCDFECQSMRVEGRGFGPGGVVKALGDLIVHGSAEITAHLYVEGEVKSETLDVDGHLKSGSLTSKRVRVGGHMQTKGKLEAETLDVGGHLMVSDSIKLVNLDVGGHARIGGGTISGGAKVMGNFESTEKLAYGELKVLGHIRLPAGSSGEHISIHGDVKFAGDTSCKNMKITGVAKVTGNCTAETVEVFGKFDVAGSLKVSKDLKVFGTTEVKQRLECDSIVVGGKLSADQILTRGQAILAGEVEVARGLKAKSIVVGKGSKVTGPLVGEEIDVGMKVDLDIGPWGSLWSGRWLSVGRMTSVEDVHGKAVRINPYSRAKRVFAEVVQMDEGSMADEVTYTSELKLPNNYHLARAPVKTARLPDPPL
jgi:cytoskeletal protein CcmA (bactofilin family)